MEKRYIGVTDEPLYMDGDFRTFLRQKQKKVPNADMVVASPMRRCVQTAKLLYPKAAPLLLSNFKECDFGLFEYKNYEELKNNPDYQKWLDSGGTIPFPGGEAHEDFLKRSRDTFDWMVMMLMEKKIDRAALIVHGGTIMSILSGFSPTKCDFYQWQVENGDGFRVMLDDEEWKQGKKRFREIQKL